METSAISARTLQYDDKNVPYYVWPPFPTAPPGVEIIPFNQFTPKGILVNDDPESDGENEVDGDGLKTKKLSVIHVSIDERDAKDKRKRAAKRRKGNLSQDDAKLYWYEEWEELESRIKITPVDHRQSTVYRFKQIMDDFGQKRRFRDDVQSIWDNFRLFTGLIAPKEAKASKVRIKGTGEITHDDPDDDDDEDSDTETAKEGDPAQPTAPPEATVVELPDPSELFVGEDRIVDFLNDPELGVKRFLSSWFNHRGMAWDEDKLRNGPILIEYLINFISRHNAVPELKRQFAAALKVIDRSKIELVATREISYTLPDNFGQAATNFFGMLELKMSQMNWVFETPDPPPPPPEDDNPPAEAPTNPVIDVGEGISVADAARDALQGDVEVNGVPLAISDEEALRVAQEGGWVDPNETPEGWGSANYGDPTTTDDTKPEGASWEVDYVKHKLTDYYETLPDNFTPVRLETSVRKIVAVELPDASSPSPFRKPVGVLVMAPWPTEATGPDDPPSTMPKPEIAWEDTSQAATVSPHYLSKDTIRVYIDKDVVPKFQERIGMGLRGLWVQVSEKKSDAQEDGEPSKKKKKKSKSKSTAKDLATEWWYSEKTLQVYVSYWTEYPEYNDS